MSSGGACSPALGKEVGRFYIHLESFSSDKSTPPPHGGGGERHEAVCVRNFRMRSEEKEALLDARGQGNSCQRFFYQHELGLH